MILRVDVFSRVRLGTPGVHALCTFQTAAALARAGARVTLHADMQGRSREEIFHVMGAGPAPGLKLRSMSWEHHAWALPWAALSRIPRGGRDGEARFVMFNEVRRYVPVLARAARRRGCRVLFEAHNAAGRMALAGRRAGSGSSGEESDRWAEKRSELEMEILSLADAVVAPQERTLRAIRPLLSREAVTEVLPNGTPIPPEPSRSTKDIDLLYVGSLQDWKGLELLLAALPALEPYRLTIVGGRSDRRREELRRLARRLGCAERVAFVPQVDPAEVWGYYARARVGLVPLDGRYLEAREYTCPVKLMEMMAAGLPVVAARLPSVGSFVREEEDVLMTDWEDAAQSAGAMRRALEEPGLAGRLGARVREKAEALSHARRGERLAGVMARAAALPAGEPSSVWGRLAYNERLMRARLRTLTVNLALVLGSVMIAVGAGEAYLRTMRPQPLEAAYMWEDGTLRHLPSFEYTYARQEFSNKVRFNSLGLRGPEIPAAKKEGVPRVLFLGDSFVEGKQVGEDEVLTAVLQRKAREHGRELEVINAGVAGYGTSEELLLWDRLAEKIDPDVVILGFYPNDVRNNLERRYFKLEDGEVVPHRRPKQPKVRWIYDVRKALAAHSHFYMLLKAGKKALRVDEEEEAREELMEMAGAGHEAAAAESRGESAARTSAPGDVQVTPRRARLLETEEVFEIPPSPAIQRGWELTEALLSEARRRVEARGARFVLAVFPTRFQVDRDLWERHARKNGLDPERYDLDRPSRRLREWAEREGVFMVDLLEPFRDRNIDNTFYFSIDAHWNPNGHELAAAKIQEAMEG